MIVSVHKCINYKYYSVKQAILRNIQDLGGLENYLTKGDKVLLKINLVMKRKPEEATTTHPIFIKALGEILIEYGCKVVIGDSPGGPFNEVILKSIYKYNGIEEVAKEIGATLNYNCNSFTLKNNNNLLLKSFIATDMLNDVDKVISVSKLKTHKMMTFTGAVKNMFGTVPGINKAEYHMNLPTYDKFADALIDICQSANPILSFMDGIEAMEGEGPSSGTPRNVNVTIASNSPYHLDKIACTLINLPLDKVPTIKRSYERGICTSDLSDIDIICENFDSLIISDFDIPKNSLVVYNHEKLPDFIKNFFNNNIQPKLQVKEYDCISCKVCEKNCPAEVIDMCDGIPNFNLKDCIRCYCCQELCPKRAITVKRPLLLKLLTRD